MLELPDLILSKHIFQNLESFRFWKFNCYFPNAETWQKKKMLMVKNLFGKDPGLEC